ncbi:MAG TPA: hypothetical protein VKG67_06000 [Gallionellaceae bacterium]|nr:hypothetical protein [Gallionellaceae bacterium]
MAKQGAKTKFQCRLTFAEGQCDAGTKNGISFNIPHKESLPDNGLARIVADFSGNGES